MSVSLNSHNGLQAYADFYDSPLPERKPAEVDLGEFQSDAVSDEVFQKILDNPQIIDKDLKNFQGDALTDEDFQKKYVMPQKVVDKVEKGTIGILANLLTLADGTDRQSIVDATVSSAGVKLDDLQDEPEDDFYHHRYNPFRRDTNFDDQDHMERPANTLKAVKNLISALAAILFGIELSKKEHIDQRSLMEMEDNFKTDKTIWELELSKKYKPYFDRNMNEAFIKADSLIKERKRYAIIAYYQRITLFAGTMVAAAGLLTGKKIITYAGMSASLITFIYMIAMYGSSSFKQANLASEIQTSAELLEKMGSAYRLADNPFVPAALD